MTREEAIKQVLSKLMKDYSALPNKEQEAEKRAEDFIRPVFEALGWKWLSREVMPQKQVRFHTRTKRVDFAFKKSGQIRHDFYVEVKRFSNKLDDQQDVLQALEYGKNGGMRCVVLTNFVRWRVFNSDFFDEPQNAEVFEFDIFGVLSNPDYLSKLMLFSRETGGYAAIDDFAKKSKHWKESADIELLLTHQLLESRRQLAKAILESNEMLFSEYSEGHDSEDVSIDACVQHVINRIIFCRMLEDSGCDPERKMEDIYERWVVDKRKQFYRDFLVPFWENKMRPLYDSTIFDRHRIETLSIKNEDVIELFEAFYKNPENGLRYNFQAIRKDVLGHAYENYLAYKTKQTSKRVDFKEGLFARKQAGIYYTPGFLVDFLVSSTLGERLKKCRNASDALKIKVIDPACGSGTFLVRAFEEFRAWYEENLANAGGSAQATLDADSGSGMSSFLTQVLEQCIYGVDMDPRAVRMARLNLFLQAVDTPKQLPRLHVIERDSLVQDGENGRKAFVVSRDFPLVSEQGGFDVVLGNPPWEKWKPDSQEFFEQYHPGFKSLPAQQAKNVVREILSKKPLIRKIWNEKLNEYGTMSDYYRDTYDYQSSEADGKKKSGDLDLYKIFTERAYQLAKDGGQVGFVVPSGIYTDLGAKGLRGMLFDKCKLKTLYSFENRGHAIFPAVHASYKPILITFEKGGKTKTFQCAFFLHGEDDLKKAVEAPTVLDVEFVKKSSPTSWGVLEIKTPKDKEIVEKLLKNPALGETISDAWNINISRGFDMTNDSHLFHAGRLSGVPMLEGKNIEQFTHQWKEAPVPRYKIDEKDVLANLKLEKIYHTGYWMAYRLIASSTNYRTFISAIIPPGYVCGNSLAIIHTQNLKQLCYLCGVMNSFVVDYFMRQKVSANINMFYFLETPVPRVSSGKLFDEIARKTAQLVSSTGEFDELKKEIGVSHGLLNESDRLLARAQIDVAVAKLYCITKEELAYILEKFPNVDSKQKEMVLQAY
ncbi:N-6 DNA methylase, partial [Candidatus Micrarchaeota archaeon]|nr:N-6 DNA methylase [Candidatus Micrarchaeota archaeon]